MTAQSIIAQSKTGALATKLRQTVEFVEKAWVTSVAFILLFLVVIVIASRLVFPGQWQAPWAEDGIRLLLTWFAFIGAFIMFVRKGHLEITFLVERLPTRPRRAILLLTQEILPIVYFVVVAGAALDSTRLRLGAYSPATGWPAWLWPLGLLVGCLLAIGYFLVKMIYGVVMWNQRR